MQLYKEALTLLEFEKKIKSHETETPLSEVKILLSSERITLSLDHISILIHKAKDSPIITPLSGATMSEDLVQRGISLQLRMGPSSSELRRD